MSKFFIVNLSSSCDSSLKVGLRIVVVGSAVVVGFSVVVVVGFSVVVGFVAVVGFVVVVGLAVVVEEGGGFVVVVS